MNVIVPPPAPVAVPGLSDALALFRALVDKPVETARTLEAMQAAVARYDQQLATYGTIQDIERLRADAEAQAAEAVKAREAAASDREQAKADAEAIRKEANDFRQKVADAAAEANAKCKAREKAVADAEKEHERQKTEFAAEMAKGRDEAQARESSLAVREGRLAERETAVNDALAKLNSLGVKV